MVEVKRTQMWSEHTGNPICVIEDDILQNGFYYNKNTGIFEGFVEECVGDKMRVFSCLGKNGDKYIEPVQVNISNKEFLICAKIIAHESGTEGEECICIAFTARNRSRRVKKSIYTLLMSGYSSVPNDEKIEMELETSDKKGLSSRVGLIKALLDEIDPTSGAEFWDGTDFLAWGTYSPNNKPHPKFKQYTKITIHKILFEKYVIAQKEKYKFGSVKYGKRRYLIPANVFLDPANWTNGNFVYSTGVKRPPAEGELEATLVTGHTIFWKVKR